MAHAIAELKARKHFLEPMGVRTYNAALKQLRESPHYDRGMDESTDEYMDFLKEAAMSFAQPPFVTLETRVDFSHYVPEGFGTADCVMIGGNRIVIVDYKNGAGVPVDAENNSQMMLYALGALHTFAPIFGNAIKKAFLAIVQPNAGGVKTWETTVDQLHSWAKEVVEPAAKLAFAGEGAFCAGDWCRFCPAKAQCSARAAQMLAVEPLVGARPGAALDRDDLLARETQKDNGQQVPPLLTDEEVGDVLIRARELAAWVKDLEDYALSACLAGRKITGFKAVEGRGSRDWADPDAAFKMLRERGVAESLLWERKPVTAPALEKALGKKTFKEAAEGLVVKKPGKPTLAPESDRRKPYNAASAAFGGA